VGACRMERSSKTWNDHDLWGEKVGSLGVKERRKRRKGAESPANKKTKTVVITHLPRQKKKKKRSRKSDQKINSKRIIREKRHRDDAKVKQDGP